MENMLKLALIIYIFSFVTGAIFNLTDLSYSDENNIEQSAKNEIKNVESNGNHILVLELNDEGLDLKTLRTANEKEGVVFDRVVGPMIEAYKYRPARLSKPVETMEAEQESREVKDRRNKKIKQEIMRLINKFAMSISTDPDVFLVDSASIEDTGPSLILFIKGPYTSLLVSSDRKEWHFFIPPPSPLPAWLYFQREPLDGAVNIPDDVRDQLFVKMLHLLRIFLAFPI
ncbi:uncharacterized protein LOC128679665 [Plodia interpunctella]|uniref:uncharacterized protein LOC128679665 n=1 Tax=Plodia interpunctella TaxID=58824 RepID=UPI002367F55E|nr:uncharacterized protein LOC128679665 [Plodia interpunctella]